MKSFIVISDTHGYGNAVINKLLPAINSCDALIHLGDGISDLYYYKNQITAKIYTVRGNCDDLCVDDDLILETDAGKILFTHGHNYSVNSDLLNLAFYSRELGCNYAFYGHTHVSSEDFYEGVTLINPGSACRPRDGFPSYAISFTSNGKLITKIMTI